MPNSFWRSGLTTILAGVSLTAAFAATGFVAAFGREQFLGIHLTDWSAQTLTLLAGRCAADSFFMVLNYLLQHLAIVVISVLVVAAVLVVSRHRRFPQWLPAAAESLITVAMAIYLLTAIIRFEAPTVLLRGWVIAPNVESPVEKAICELSPYPEKCSKEGSKPAAAGVTRIEHYSRAAYNLKTEENPGMLLLESSSPNAGELLKDYHFTNPRKPKAAHDLLYDKYASLVLISLLSLFFLAFFGKCPKAPLWSDVLTVARTVLAIVAGVSTLLIPYVYGKLIDPALFPNAFLQYLEDQPKSVMVTGDNVVKIAGDDPIKKAGEFPVVSQSDSSIFILWIQQGSGLTQLIEIPREKIVSIYYEGDVDALAKITDCRKKGKSDKADVACQ